VRVEAGMLQGSCALPCRRGPRGLFSFACVGESGLLSWLRRRREQTERIEAEADALISNLGDGAYSEARRRARESSID